MVQGLGWLRLTSGGPAYTAGTIPPSHSDKPQASGKKQSHATVVTLKFGIFDVVLIITGFQFILAPP